MSQCNKGYKGDCCCNCQYQCQIQGHPHNKTPEYRKPTTGDSMAYGCTVFFVGHQLNKEPGIQHEGDLGIVTIFESGHGICEMHQPRK